MAFVFLNRYLDITEAMEEGGDSSNSLDNSDFVDTAIPTDFPIPDKQFLSDKDREKVRDYVLELSMNEKVQQSLNVAELDAICKEADTVRDAPADARRPRRLGIGVLHGHARYLEPGALRRRRTYAVRYGRRAARARGMDARAVVAVWTT